MTQPEQIIIRKSQLPALLGISIPTIDRLRVKGDFPAPIMLGAQAVGFRRSDIDAWLAKRPLCNHFAMAIEI